MNTEIANVITTEKLNEQFEFFESEDFGRLEILVINGKIYFPAIQAARTLGYKNPRDAIKKHCLEDGVVFHDGTIFCRALSEKGKGRHREKVKEDLPEPDFDIEDIMK